MYTQYDWMYFVSTFEQVSVTPKLQLALLNHHNIAIECIDINPDLQIADRDDANDELLLPDDQEEDVIEHSMELYQQARNLEKQIQALETSLSQEKALVRNQEPQWDLQLVNGELRLATEIRSLEELMLYGKSAIRYLSPFGNTFRAKTIVFQRMHTSLVRSAMQIITRSLHQSDDPKSTSSPKAISKRFSTGVTAFWEPQFFIERLIANFFSCFNDIVSILHEPSFMEHFHTLPDPMQDPVVLAISVFQRILL
ncbi:hypothetical protein G6F42_016941 [Rhizopus arrhizus]|nr:hypothetical protein G6F42_016941 [Rhizopus arrhizus]